MMIREFAGDWGHAAGEILASWFIANPNGPTAFAVGFLEMGEERVLFYRHMHFTGGRCWIVSELLDEVKAQDGDFGGVLINTLLRLNNHFLVNGGDQVFLKEIPHVIITNGNPSVTSAFFEFIKLSTVEENWGRHLYFDRKYGCDFFRRFEEEYRDIYESLKAQPDADQKFVDFIRIQHGRRKGFIDWEPDQYTSATQTDAMFQEWLDIVYDQDYIQNSLYEIAQMWVGACYMQRDTGLLNELRSSGKLETLDELLTFFANMNMPLLPDEITELYLKNRMRVDY